MTEMRVECYSGYRPDERPLRFVFHGHEYEVQDLDGQWYSPEATYFRVRAQDGNYYVLTISDRIRGRSTASAPLATTPIHPCSDASMTLIQTSRSA